MFLIICNLFVSLDSSTPLVICIVVLGYVRCNTVAEGSSHNKGIGEST